MFNFQRRNNDIILLISLSAMKNGGLDGSQKQKPKSSKASKLLDVFIRNNKKQALLVHTPSNANLEQISRAISIRFRVPTEDQVLYHNGIQIDLFHPNQEIDLEDKAVIHLVDRKNIGQQITVNVRRLNLPKVQQFRIPSAQIIEDFIVRNIRDEQPEKMFFVYTGRQLKKNRSFADEFVENDSELFCLHEDRDEVKGDRRKYYERKIKDENERKKQNNEKGKVKYFKEEEQGDNVLFNYIPRQGKRQEERSRGQHNEEVKPNFKKKVSGNGISLSGNVQPLRKSNMVEGNLSIVNENFHESHSVIGNSTYFNDGSSISEIIPDYNHNPESSKKIEEGSMFQSAIMGLNTEPSQITNKAAEHDIPEEEEDKNNEKDSFSFNTRAPELLQAPDKQLTLLQREIMEVAESQEQEESRSRVARSKDVSIEQDQFQLGEIQNHLLSASTEMKVEDPSSPMPRSAKNQILIQQQLSEHEVSDKDKNLEYANVQIQEVSNEPSQSEDYETEKGNKEGEFLSKNEESIEDDVQFQEEKINETPLLNESPPQEQVDIFIIEQEGNSQTQTLTASEMIEEKEELQTHGPSSNSNLYSKNSSRVKQFETQPNQYEFGNYSKPFNRPTTQSSCYETNIKSEENLLDTPKSQKNDKSSSAIQHSKDHQQVEDEHENKDHNDSQDLELQIVDLPLDIKAHQHARELMNYESQIILKSKSEEKIQEKPEKQKQYGDKFKRGESRIDQLNCLLIDYTPKKEENEEPSEESKDSNLLSHESSVKQIQSDIKVDYFPVQKENQPINDSQNFSKESLQLVRLKKTQRTVSKMDLLLKNTSHKQSFSPNTYIFKNEMSFFDPLDFYVKLLDQETLASNFSR